MALKKGKNAREILIAWTRNLHRLDEKPSSLAREIPYEKSCMKHPVRKILFEISCARKRTYEKSCSKIPVRKFLCEISCTKNPVRIIPFEKSRTKTPARLA